MSTIGQICKYPTCICFSSLSQEGFEGNFDKENGFKPLMAMLQFLSFPIAALAFTNRILTHVFLITERNNFVVG